MELCPYSESTVPLTAPIVATVRSAEAFLGTIGRRHVQIPFAGERRLCRLAIILLPRGRSRIG